MAANTTAAGETAPILSLRNVSKYFSAVTEQEDGQKSGGVFTALKDISFSLESGTCTLIAGANGSGKSVLMSIIAGLDAPGAGTVHVRDRVGLVFQDPDSQILGETPREDIAFGVRNLGRSKNEIADAVSEALAETGLEARADYPARSLSGGEKRRLAVAGVLAMDARIIIFDEPYAHMDYPGVIQVNSLIQKLLERAKTIIILTHEIEKCMALAGRFIVLSGGKLVFDGSPEQALARDLAAWGIHHPLSHPAASLEDLLWR